MQQPIATSTPKFLVYLAALIAFSPFAIDIYLSSMPIIQQLFATTATRVQLTLSIFFVGSALMQLFWGPLSDRIGRRPVILIGVSIFIFGSVLCALSQTIAMLIVSRLIQAIGACAGVVMALAIIKDRFPEPSRMTNALSVMTSIMVLAPMVAPIIGSYLLVHFGWQSNFYFLAIYGLVLLIATFFISESYPDHLRKPLPLNQLYQAYMTQLTCYPFLLCALAVATNFSVVFTFISTSAFIYIGIYHVSTHLFGYVFAANAIGLIVGNVTIKKLTGKIDNYYLVLIPIGIIAIMTGLMMVLLHYFPEHMMCVMVPSFVVTCGVGMLYPALTSLALQNVVAYTGLASSLLGSCRFVLAAVTGAVMGALIVSTAMPLAMMMFGLNAVTAALMLMYFRHTTEVHTKTST